MDTKKCSGCKRAKLRTEFSVRKASVDGLKSQCKECIAGAARDKRAWIRENHVCSVKDCGLEAYCLKPMILCSMHRSRQLTKGDVGDAKSTRNARGSGANYINSDGYRIIGTRGNTMLEHRWVMEQHLGRKLLPNENVHHVNGDRADNRLENLELWNTSQPPGQRVEDKVAWALEIIALYSPEVLL